MSATPDQVARRWLATKLEGAAIASAGSTGAHDHPAPDDAVEPFISVEFLTERAVSPVGKNADIYKVRELIRVWDSGSSAARADGIAGAIHDAIHKADPEAVTGGQVISCERLGGVPFDHILEQGTTYRISGGEYELLVLVS